MNSLKFSGFKVKTNLHLCTFAINEMKIFFNCVTYIQT